MSQPDSEFSFNRFDRSLKRGLSLVYAALRQLPLAATESEVATVPDSLARSLMLARVRCEEVIEFATKQFWDAATDFAYFERAAEALSKRKDRKELLTRARRQLELHRENLRVLGVEVRQFEPGSAFDPGTCDPIEFVNSKDKQADSTIAECLKPAFSWTDEWGQQQVIPAEVTVYRFVSTVSEDLAAELAMARTNGNGQHRRSKAQVK